jgi:hypothetical protein
MHVALRPLDMPALDSGFIASVARPALVAVDLLEVRGLVSPSTQPEPALP